MSEYIEQLKAELLKLKRYPKGKLSRFQPYFKITKHTADSGFDFEVDLEKIEELRKSKGYFLIFSTEPQALQTTSSTIITVKMPMRKSSHKSRGIWTVVASELTTR